MHTLSIKIYSSNTNTLNSLLAFDNKKYHVKCRGKRTVNTSYAH